MFLNHVVGTSRLVASSIGVAVAVLGYICVHQIADAQTNAEDYFYQVTRGTTDSSMPSPRGGTADLSAHGFRFWCVPSHYTYDDPVVYPGEAGRAHLHMFFGNTETDFDSTSSSIVNRGGSTCDGGITNRSAYWVPALFNEDGEVVLPKTISNYYKSWVSNRSLLRPIPQGLQILANDRVRNSGGVTVARPGSPQDTWQSSIRVSDHDGLTIEILFPDCIAVDGDGNPIFSSPGGTSHVAYSQGACPSSHPYNIPQLTQIINWDNVPYGSDWMLASDMMSNSPKGSTAHADYIAGWTTQSSQIMLDCVRDGARECGPPLQQHWQDQFFSPDGERVYDYFRVAAGVDATILDGWPAMLDMNNMPMPHEEEDEHEEEDNEVDVDEVEVDEEEDDEVEVDEDEDEDETEETDDETTTTTTTTSSTRVVTTDNLYVRSSPNGTKVGQQWKGAMGTMKEGSKIAAGGYNWVYVDFDASPDGYVADAYLAAKVTTTNDSTTNIELRKKIVELMAQLQKLLELYQKLFGSN